MPTTSAGGRLGRRPIRRLGPRDRTDSKPPATRSSMPSRRRCPASRSSWSTATTTCSRPIRSTNGFRPPFEPTVRDGNIYARGATDDKGQMLTHVKSAEAWIKTGGKLPLQVKFLIEGEEEVGSENLEPFVDSRIASSSPATASSSATAASSPPACRRSPTACAASPTSSCDSPARSRICTPARSAAASRIRPMRWSTMLAALKDERRPRPSPRLLRRRRAAHRRRARKSSATLPLRRSRVHEAGRRRRRLRRSRLHARSNAAGPARRATSTASRAAIKAKGRRRSCRPGPAPSSASAWCRTKIPQKIAAALRKFLEARLPARHRDGTGRSPRRAGRRRAARQPVHARGRGRDRKRLRPPTGVHPRRGSIPIVTTFARELGVDALLLGWGQNDDNTHSPNEKFCLADFHRGIRASAHFGKSSRSQTLTTKPRQLSTIELRVASMLDRTIHSRKCRARPRKLRPPRREGRRRSVRRARNAAPRNAGRGRRAIAAGQ